MHNLHYTQTLSMSSIDITTSPRKRLMGNMTIILICGSPWVACSNLLASLRAETLPTTLPLLELTELLMVRARARVLSTPFYVYTRTATYKRLSPRRTRTNGSKKSDHR